MDDEIKMAFELTYMPLAYARKRLNGKDFMGVAVSLMDQVRGQTSDPGKIREAADTMVKSFNDMLDPKLPGTEIENMIDLLVRNGPMTRMIAEQSQQENEAWMTSNMK